MSEFIMAEQNSRTISGDDKIFGISKLAKDAAAKLGSENVVNATIGSLIDDNGNLIVMPSIVEIIKNLDPEDFSDYAPIAGIPAFLEAAKKAVFGNHFPEGFMEAVATPGGTGAIRNTIQNYTQRGDIVITSDWFWSPYNTIADEIGRKLETYQLFNEKDGFNTLAFEAKIKEVLSKQPRLLVILNAPAHNPTGFSPSEAEWNEIISILKNAAKDTTKKFTLLIDTAYIDFAGDPDKCRQFLPKLSNLPENILIITAFSMSKAYTLYGMRSGAMICITPNEDIADEFKKVCMYSNRGTWSNGTRPAMTVLTKIFEDETLKAKVDAERAYFRNILIKRGDAFMEASKISGLKTCPFDSGFFITVPCENAEEVGKELQKDAIFAVPIGKGIRVSISAISEEKCKLMPGKMAAAIKKING